MDHGPLEAGIAEFYYPEVAGVNVQIVIRKPIWNGRKVGLAERKLIGDKVNVIIEYRNREGKLEFPNVYEISCDKAREYPRQNTKGVWLYIVPIADLTSIAVREEMQLWPN